MRSNPSLARGLATSLTSNYLGSAGGSLYLAFIRQIGKDSPELWSEHFLPVLVEALTSPNLLVQTNAKNHWLLPTLKWVPKSKEMLLSSFGTQRDVDSDGSHLAAALLIMKISRQSGQLEQLTEDNFKQVEVGMSHLNPMVRIAAFSVLCHSKKRANAPSAREVKIFRDFLEHNLTVDNPSFRQMLLSDCTNFLLRCRDPLNVMIRRGSLDDNAKTVLEVLSSTLEMLFRNCYPGANYQRQVTCLEVIKIFLSCFDSDSQLLRDTVFENRKFFNVLLSCANFYMSNVRELSFCLLRKFPTPKKGILRGILSKALQLMCSPKFAQCESGAGLAQLVNFWRRTDHIDVKDLFHGVQVANCKLFQESLPVISADSKTICEILLGTYRNLMSKAETNFLTLAKESPMHGILTAVRICLKDELILVPDGFLNQLIETLTRSVQLMLDSLSVQKKETADSASFADMGQAIEALIDTEEEHVEISGEHQLVLACAWLNLKECSLLSGFLVKTCDLSPEIVKNDTLNAELVKQCGEILTNVLTRCRHKGAIEATNLACLDFSSRLLADPDDVFNKIPENILIAILDDLESMRSSVTRRAAGLPMIIQKIVVSESRGKAKTLLNMTVQRLLDMGNQSRKNVISETQDHSQTLSLHILQRLVHDSSLAHDIAQHLSPILRCTVSNFSSGHWAVRNAALQLFGAIVPRILGQKKVRTEGSLHNSLTLPEFLSRYSDLIPFLLEQLLNDSKESSSFLVNPALVPLLSLLSRIAPGGSVDKSSLDSVQKMKSAFFKLLGSRVINVRILAGKALAAFTQPSLLEREIGFILRLLEDPRIPINFQNGLLLAAKELLCVGIKEHNVSTHFDALRLKAENMNGSTLKSFVNLVLWREISEILKIESEQQKDYQQRGDEKKKDGENLSENKGRESGCGYGPGFAEWSERRRTNQIEKELALQNIQTRY